MTEFEPFAEVKLKFNDSERSFFIVNDQTKDTLDVTIRSLWDYHLSPEVTCIGITELNANEEEVGPLIPLKLLATKNGIALIKEAAHYKPKFHFGNSGGSSVQFSYPEDGMTITPPVPENTGFAEIPSASIPSPAAELPPPPVPVPPYAHQHQHQHAQHHVQQQVNESGADPWQNWEYFYQYGKLGIHAEMLKDESRTQTYRDAILAHAADFKDKVVMDLGAGTGILSFFAAKAGAARVYAVEASNLTEWTELVIASNGLSDKIKLIKGRIEEIHLPEKVDIIISEWMGTFLIFESMLESLLYARDHMLKENGILFPGLANIYLSPVCMDDFFAEKVTFWNNVYDIDMSVLIPFAKKCAFEKPLIDKVVKPEWVIADPTTIKSLDLKNVPIWEPYEKTIVKFNFTVKKTGNFHGFAAWFDVIFRGTDTSKDVILSTSPDHKDTHWHQDLFLFDNPVAVKEGQTIKGTIRYQRNPELLRHLIIDISFAVSETGWSQSKKFFLWGNE
eukprot:TRINITY_DN2723_c0_g1_i2.p1 TRINITY_DN2723_c0_g1~~TRINITY_DN2723_c0_g1_i2.p1  ORF type:complete len:505 (-),score=105.55 TRINITY_DN2723_c0_g1_i2:734-2248(-)